MAGTHTEAAEMRKPLSIIAAFLLTLIAGVVALVFFGGMLPMWSMVHLYGLKQVQDAPAHGGLILLFTLPITGLLVLIGMVPFGLFIYRRLSARWRKT